MTGPLLPEDQDRLCTLTLNRPDKLNALNTALFERLDAQLADLEAQAGRIGCVVPKGSGQIFRTVGDMTAITQGVPAPPTFKPRVIEAGRIAAAGRGVCPCRPRDRRTGARARSSHHRRRPFRAVCGYAWSLGLSRGLGYGPARAAAVRRRPRSADVNDRTQDRWRETHRIGLAVYARRMQRSTKRCSCWWAISSPAAGTPIARPRDCCENPTE